MEIALVRSRMWPLVRFYGAIILDYKNFQTGAHGLYRQIVAAVFEFKRSRPGRVFPIELARNREIMLTANQKCGIAYMKIGDMRSSAADEANARRLEYAVQFFQPIVMHDLGR